MEVIIYGESREGQGMMFVKGGQCAAVVNKTQLLSTSTRTRFVRVNNTVAYYCPGPGRLGSAGQECVVRNGRRREGLASGQSSGEWWLWWASPPSPPSRIFRVPLNS